MRKKKRKIGFGILITGLSVIGVSSVLGAILSVYPKKQLNQIQPNIENTNTKVKNNDNTLNQPNVEVENNENNKQPINKNQQLWDEIQQLINRLSVFKPKYQNKFDELKVENNENELLELKTELLGYFEDYNGVELHNAIKIQNDNHTFDNFEKVKVISDSLNDDHTTLEFRVIKEYFLDKDIMVENLKKYEPIINTINTETLKYRKRSLNNNLINKYENLFKIDPKNINDETIQDVKNRDNLFLTPMNENETNLKFKYIQKVNQFHALTYKEVKIPFVFSDSQQIFRANEMFTYSISGEILKNYEQEQINVPKTDNLNIYYQQKINVVDKYTTIYNRLLDYVNDFDKYYYKIERLITKFNDVGIINPYRDIVYKRNFNLNKIIHLMFGNLKTTSKNSQISLDDITKFPTDTKQFSYIFTLLRDGVIENDENKLERFDELLKLVYKFIVFQTTTNHFLGTSNRNQNMFDQFVDFSYDSTFLKSKENLFKNQQYYWEYLKDNVIDNLNIDNLLKTKYKDNIENLINKSIELEHYIKTIDTNKGYLSSFINFNDNPDYINSFKGNPFLSVNFEQFKKHTTKIINLMKEIKSSYDALSMFNNLFLYSLDNTIYSNDYSYSEVSTKYDFELRRTINPINIRDFTHYDEWMSFLKSANTTINLLLYGNVYKNINDKLNNIENVFLFNVNYEPYFNDIISNKTNPLYEKYHSWSKLKENLSLTDITSNYSYQTFIENNIELFKTTTTQLQNLTNTFKSTHLQNDNVTTMLTSNPNSSPINNYLTQYFEVINPLVEKFNLYYEHERLKTPIQKRISPNSNQNFDILTMSVPEEFHNKSIFGDMSLKVLKGMFEILDTSYGFILKKNKPNWLEYFNQDLTFEEIYEKLREYNSTLHNFSSLPNKDDIKNLWETQVLESVDSFETHWFRQGWLFAFDNIRSLSTISLNNPSKIGDSNISLSDINTLEEKLGGFVSIFMPKTYNYTIRPIDTTFNLNAIKEYTKELFKKLDHDNTKTIHSEGYHALFEIDGILKQYFDFLIHFKELLTPTQKDIINHIANQMFEKIGNRLYNTYDRMFIFKQENDKLILVEREYEELMKNYSLLYMIARDVLEKQRKIYLNSTDKTREEFNRIYYELKGYLVVDIQWSKNDMVSQEMQKYSQNFNDESFDHLINFMFDEVILEDFTSEPFGSHSPDVLWAIVSLNALKEKLDNTSDETLKLEVSNTIHELEFYYKNLFRRNGIKNDLIKKIDKILERSSSD